MPSKKLNLVDYRATGTVSSISSKNKKIYSKNVSCIFSTKFFLYFVKWNFLALRLKNFLHFTTLALKIFPWKNFLYFLKKKFFSYFRKWNFLIFSQKKKAFGVFREIKPFKKTSYISGGNFLSSKNKKTYPEIFFYISGNGTF